MKKLLFGIFVFLVAVNSFAQDEFTTGENVKIKRYGIKTALCLAHLHNTHELEIQANDLFKNRAGFSGGFYMDAIGASGHYSTQFGVQYTGMGTKLDFNDAKVRFHYIQIPLTFNVRAGYKFINAFCGGGIYGAGTFAAKSEYNDLITGKKETDEEILSMPDAEGDKMKSFHYFDAGMIFGGGLEFVLPNDHAIQVGVHYYRGFIKISNETGIVDESAASSPTYNPGTQNRAIMISVSYLVKK